MSISIAPPEEWDLDEANDALEDLRAARRRNRVARIDLFDAFYKAYLTAILGGIAIYGGAGWFGDAPIRGASVDRVADEGPLYLGLLVAAAVAVGLRSGGRGGPLAFEQAEVRHVLLSPADRRDSIRKPAVRQLRHAAFLGTAFGAAVGLVVLRRFPGVPVVWIACAAAFGGAVAILAYGVAMFAGGRRLPSPVTDTLAFVFLLWAGAAVAFGSSYLSPFAWIGHVALWPIGFHWLGVVGLVIATVIAVVGRFSVDGISIEAAERRSRLVGQLRFAATLQDVRTVMVLQRQLAQERLRVRPRIPLRPLRQPFKKDGQPRLRVFAYRSLHGLLRWSVFRQVRLAVLALIAGFAVCGAWAGSMALIAVAGIALWVIALDLLEPLAQESDHPDRLLSVPRPPGWTLGRHLVVPGFVLLALVIFGSIPAIVLGDPDIVGPLAPPTILACTVLPLGGAALAVSRQYTASTGAVTPEVAGMMMAWRLLMPPGLAVAGLVPLAIAHREWERAGSVIDAVNAMTFPWYAVLAFGTWALLWIRHGGEIRDRAELSGAQFTRGPDTEKK